MSLLPGHVAVVRLAAAALLAPLVLVASSGTSSAAPAARPTCAGLPATVVIGRGERPTNGPDVIVGTKGNDVIRALGGDDVVCGRGGDDRLLGGPGDDRLLGGPGRDWVVGHGGADVLRGGSGTDVLAGRGGRDVLRGGSGRDECSTGGGTTDARCESVVEHRIMVVGDSISSGSDGDFTWRYRLWQHFRGLGTAVDLVGHRETMVSLGDWVHDSLAYADPAFDRDHSALSGGSLWRQERPMAALVRRSRPDVTIIALGTNDLGLYKLTPAETAGLLARSVESARSADPGATVVLAHVPTVRGPRFARFNERVDRLAVDLSTRASRVVASAWSSGYVSDLHNTDGVHPNARGELLLAAATADSLARLGIGAPHLRPLPELPIGPRWVSPLTATPATERSAVELTWQEMPGVTHNVLWRRNATRDRAWERVGEVHGTSTTVAWLNPGDTYEFMLQPAKFQAESELRSPVASAVPLAAGP